ncbi:MAG: hypothetical protein L0216_08315 [Planctomycetales bacterium]|nr:hypothetical protein [Planctomycetales bacterium]
MDASGAPREDGRDDLRLARRKLLGLGLYAVPAILGTFTVTRPAEAATCSPCTPSSCPPRPCPPR